MKIEEEAYTQTLIETALQRRSRGEGERNRNKRVSTPKGIGREKEKQDRKGNKRVDTVERRGEDRGRDTKTRESGEETDFKFP